MSERDALMTAILRKPGADAPRLAFANWLEGHGDPDRATFIRLQCKVARLRPGGEERRLQTAAAALLDRHRAEWLAELGPGVTRPVFERGFVADVTMTADDFLRHAGTVMSRAPVRTVAITKVSGHIPRLAACPDLGRVDRLVLRENRLGDPAAQALAESPYLRRIESLKLWANEIGADGVRAILDATAGGRTRQIDFGCNRLGDTGVAVLAGHPATAAHTDLLLFENRIGPAGAEALAASPHLGRVSDCILEMNAIGDGGVAALARSKSFRPEVLDLSITGVTDAGVELLAASRVLRRIEWLGLADNGLGDRAALALARSRRLRHLRILSIAGNRITDAGAVALRDGLGNMHTLFMTDNLLSVDVADDLFVFSIITGQLRGR